MHLVYDVSRQRVVYIAWRQFSGNDIQDVWEWDGIAWQQQTPPCSPPGRDAPTVAYDRVRGVTVLFGGYRQGHQQDMWEWNGTTWSNPNPATRPPAREQAAMVFDPTTQRLLMYRGFDASLRFIDTWTWDGVTWHQHFPITPPFPRDRASMAGDLARSRVVLYGSGHDDPQTWEWDGQEWHFSQPGSPGPLRFPSIAYDTVRLEVVLHGGESTWGVNNYTWLYRTPLMASASPFGSGCTGTTRVPVLANVPWHLRWLGDMTRNRVSGLAPGSPGALFATSFSQSILPMSLAPLGAPGCNLLLPPDSLDFALAAGTNADWTLTIPLTPSLAGVAIYQQAFPVDVGVNPLGLTASNGLRMVTGIR